MMVYDISVVSMDRSGISKNSSNTPYSTIHAPLITPYVLKHIWKASKYAHDTFL